MGKWNNYLTELMKKNVKWDDPKLLMCKFGITETAAQQIIDGRKVELELAKQEWEDVNNEGN